MGQNLSLVIAIGVPVVQGGLIGYFNSSSVQTWYKTLKRPKWTPPDWLFGPVWTALYGCMGTASWLIWRKGGFVTQKTPLSLYVTQLILNFLWNPIFFGARNPKLALIDIATLDVVLAATIVSFYKESKTAGSLLLPYMAWSLYATALNAKIVYDNRHQEGKKKGAAGESSNKQEGEQMGH